MNAVYLDHAATTRPEERVLEAMLHCARSAWANPSSAYGASTAARRELRLAREFIAGMMGAKASEVYFTSGGSEGNNCALRLAAGKHAVISAVEHSSVLEAAKLWGCRVTAVQPDQHGVIRPEAVEAALEPDTTLVAVQWANNETGVIHPVEEISRITRARGIHFHVDAVQAFGHIPVDVSCCDSLSTSAHKLYGPRGVGCLYLRKGCAVEPLMAGGGQERGMRAGTENVAGVCGFRIAAEMAAADLEERRLREASLLDSLTASLQAEISGLRRLGEGAPRLPGVTAFLLPGVPSATAGAALDALGVLVSGGSACSARSGKVSHVYSAMGLTHEEAGQVIRVSVGRHTTLQDMETAARAIIRVWKEHTNA